MQQFIERRDIENNCFQPTAVSPLLRRLSLCEKQLLRKNIYTHIFMEVGCKETLNRIFFDRKAVMWAEVNHIIPARNLGN